MTIGRGNWRTRKKPTLVPLLPPQIPHDLTWARTRAAVVGSWRLTAWSMAWPNYLTNKPTNQFRLAESFIRSNQSLRYSGISQNFLEPEGSGPYRDSNSDLFAVQRVASLCRLHCPGAKLHTESFGVRQNKETVDKRLIHCSLAWSVNVHRFHKSVLLLSSNRLHVSYLVGAFCITSCSFATAWLLAQSLRACGLRQNSLASQESHCSHSKGDRHNGSQSREIGPEHSHTFRQPYFCLWVIVSYVSN
jgi:hypothetical protein